MDFILLCLNFTPAPGVAHATSLFRSIWSLIQQTKNSKQQLLVLAEVIAQLLCTLNAQLLDVKKKVEKGPNPDSLSALARWDVAFTPKSWARLIPNLLSAQSIARDMAVHSTANHLQFPQVTFHQRGPYSTNCNIPPKIETLIKSFEVRTPTISCGCGLPAFTDILAYRY